MRRLGESEREYVARLKREDGDTGGNILSDLLFLLPEWILLPLITLFLVGVGAHIGAVNVAWSYYLTLDGILLAILTGIYYFKRKFKVQLLGTVKGRILPVALEHVLYGKSDKAKRIRIGAYVIWVLVFIWLFPY